MCLLQQKSEFKDRGDEFNLWHGLVVFIPPQVPGDDNQQFDEGEGFRFSHAI